MNHMKESWTGRCYDLWAKFYDKTFGALVHKRHLRAMQELRTQPGDVVLDLGVGTGMTLPEYADNVTVIGMDLSAGMLGKAMDKKRQLEMEHVSLIQADAMFPPLAEQSFDHIMIAHTISVVSEPNKLLKWATKLVKPGGTIVLLNHFHARNRIVAFFETLLNPMFVKIGWKSDLALEDCLKDTGLHVRYHFKTSAIDIWQIVVLSPLPTLSPEPAEREASAPIEAGGLRLAGE